MSKPQTKKPAATDNLLTAQSLTHIFPKQDGLTPISTSAYAVGHVVNDITSSFNLLYMMYYVTNILHLPSDYASCVFLAGQVTDATCTPIVGYLSDNSSSALGKRKPFYIAGIFFSILCSLAIFNAFGDVFNFYDKESWADQDARNFYIFVYYASCWSCYNIGFALCQVSHLAVIPTSSANDNVRGLLVSYRTAFVYLSGLACMLISMIVTNYYELREALMYTVWINSSIAFITSMFFVFCYDEVNLTRIVNNYFNSQYVDGFMIKKPIDNNNNDIVSISTDVVKSTKVVKIMSWMKLKMFWIKIITYISARVIQNVVITLMNIYIENSLGSKRKFDVVWIPFLYMVFSIFGSILSSKIISKVPRSILLNVCNLLLLICNMLLIVISMYVEDFMTKIISAYLIYAFLGFLSSLYLSVATCLISDLIGEYGNSGAFVYGFYGMVDKLAVGLMIFSFYKIFDVRNQSEVAVGTTIYPIIFVILSFLTSYFGDTFTQFHRDDFH